MKLQRTRIEPVQMEEIQRAKKKLKEGGIICLPTDTVYGLAVDAKNKEAVEGLYKLKKRTKDKPLILFLKSQRRLINFVKKIPPSALKLMNYFWPGSLTLVFEANIGKWPLVTEEGKIGVRVPFHPVPLNIAEDEDILLATTSANISGEKAVADPKNLSEKIKEAVDILIDTGPSPSGEESTVVDVTFFPPKILRKGKIREEKIREVLSEPTRILFVCSGNVCRSVMAEYLFKKFWPSEYQQKVEVTSAGTSALSSSSPSRLTREVMEKRKIDVSSHRSRYTDLSIISRSDLVLVMEEKHKNYLNKIYPQAKEKIFMLSEFASGKKENIIDPLNQSETFYEKTCQIIEREIKKLIKKLGVGDNK